MSKGTGKRTFFRNLIILLGLACMVVAGYSSFEVSNKAREDQSNIQAVANLRVKSLRITQLARNASAGDEQAFDSLTTLNAQMNNGWTGLKNRLVKQAEVAGSGFRIQQNAPRQQCQVQW